ncbi:hypothetical protein HELRODRAFT_173631 [Helobdella robusta]|uniref:SRCR domain-containing protein n=1 Tax=Helobdella robusta TaxID=6412 RepID=T1F726_HELRO|nr:hypothetical protein HELRODRAFT_173631 [Helobdella robusta]ESO03343.1 hypothetical protein HELRODRAFT_173631 [Helobdella robusta]
MAVLSYLKTSLSLIIMFMLLLILPFFNAQKADFEEVYPLRLVGKRPNRGRLEVLYKGQWGSVCSDCFREFHCNIICRQLGYKYDDFEDLKNGPIWLDQVCCLGHEGNIFQCPHQNWGETDCTHDEDVGCDCDVTANLSDVYRIIPFDVNHPWIGIVQLRVNNNHGDHDSDGGDHGNDGGTLGYNDKDRDDDDGGGGYDDDGGSSWVGVCSEHWGHVETLMFCTGLGYVE